MEETMDIVKLIHIVEAELRQMKKTFRDPAKQPPKWELYSSIAAAKAQATLLCAAQAHKRGRLHCKKWTMEQQAALVLTQLPGALDAKAA
jgi:hypothetical protein